MPEITFMEAVGSINRMRDQLADLARLRHSMDEWGFNTDEITEMEDHLHNRIDEYYTIIETLEED